MDDDIVQAMGFVRKEGVMVHVRGTDERPIVELRDKWSRRVVGGIELKRRMEQANGKGE